MRLLKHGTDRLNGFLHKFSILRLIRQDLRRRLAINAHRLDRGELVDPDQMMLPTQIKGFGRVLAIRFSPGIFSKFLSNRRSNYA